MRSAEAAFVVGRVLLVAAVHDQDDADGRGLDVVGVAGEGAEPVEHGVIADDDEVPGLAVLGAAGPTGDLVDVVEGGLGDGVRGVVADGAQIEQEVDLFAEAGVVAHRSFLTPRYLFRVCRTGADKDGMGVDAAQGDGAWRLRGLGARANRTIPSRVAWSPYVLGGPEAWDAA